MIGWVLPWVLVRRFDPAAARELQATFELTVSDRPYAVIIGGGRCRVRRGRAPEASAWARVGPADLWALARGAAAWPEFLSSGRFELGGDPFLALRLPALFRLPVGR